MRNLRDNRFQTFFEASSYTGLKNLLYNYRLRKRRVAKKTCGRKGLLLEVGSGISPMVTDSDAVVYSDLSFSAMQLMRSTFGKGRYVVADAGRLPFRANTFQTVVCSEVLEHIEDDRKCIGELGRVLGDGDRLVLTFPHRRAYFANDDRFVRHHRRYELPGMKRKLAAAGFEVREIEKVLGPLEKAAMMIVIGCISWIQGRKEGRVRKSGRGPVPGWLRRAVDVCNRMVMVPVWLDALAMPRSMASVILIVAELSGTRDERHNSKFHRRGFRS